MSIKLELDDFLLNKICDKFIEIGLIISPSTIKLIREGKGFNRCQVDGRPKTKKDGTYFIDINNPVIGFFAQNKFLGLTVKGNCYKDIIRAENLRLIKSGDVLTNVGINSYYHHSEKKYLPPPKVLKVPISPKFIPKSSEERSKEIRAQYLRYKPIFPINQDYFIRKAYPDLRFSDLRYNSFNKSVIIPLYDICGQINAIQVIYPDDSDKTRSGTQKLCVGPYANCFNLIHDEKVSPIEVLSSIQRTKGCVFITEGYVTGLSIFEITKTPTLVSISADNLPNVVKVITKEFPNITIIICADRDKIISRVSAEGVTTTQQAGHKSIIKSYESILQDSETSRFLVEYILPDFKPGDSAAEGGKFSDFNDIRVEYGLSYYFNQFAYKLAVMQLNNAIKIFNAHKEKYNSLNSIDSKEPDTSIIFAIKKRFFVKNAELQTKVIENYSKLLSITLKSKIVESLTQNK